MTLLIVFGLLGNLHFPMSTLVGVDLSGYKFKRQISRGSALLEHRLPNLCSSLQIFYHCSNT